MKFLGPLFVFFVCSTGLADSNAAILHAALAGGGGRSISANYLVDASIGGWGGNSVGSVTAVITRPGFIGQLNEPPQTSLDILERFPGKSVKVFAQTLLANDTDAEREPILLTAVHSPSLRGAALTLIGRWVFFEPVAGNAEEDAFFYTVVDALGQPALGMAQVVIRLPNEATPNHRIEVLGHGRLRIAFAGIPNRLYRLEYADTLTPPFTVWYPLTTGTANALGWYAYEDILPAGVETRFYRSVEP